MQEIINQIFIDNLDKANLLIGLGQGIGLIGSLFYVFFRVWGHLARNEAIDVYPLLRPVALGLVLMSYGPLTKGLIYSGQKLDTFLSQVFDFSAQQAELSRQQDIYDSLMVKQQEIGIKAKKISKDVQAALADSATTGDQVSNLASAAATFIGGVTGVSNIIDYINNWFWEIITWLCKIIFYLSALGIQTVSVFYLIILLIMGPIVIGLGNFDWFYNGISLWLSRVINVMLYVPIARILGFIVTDIHIAFYKMDIADLQDYINKGESSIEGQTIVQIAFYILGIYCYSKVFIIAGWIVEGSVGSFMSSQFNKLTSPAGSAGGTASGMVMGGIKGFVKSGGNPAGAAAGAAAGGFNSAQKTMNNIK